MFALVLYNIARRFYNILKQFTPVAQIELIFEVRIIYSTKQCLSIIFYARITSFVIIVRSKRERRKESSVVY